MTIEDGVSSEHSRAKAVRILLITGILLDVIAMGSYLAQYRLLGRAASGSMISDAEATANDARLGVIGGLQILVFIVTAVCWLVWFHRAYGNLRLMGTGSSDWSPGWAVGWWFVPVMNLVRPYQLTKEVWLRSARLNLPESVGMSGPPGLVTSWWGIYLVSGFLSQGLASWSNRAESIEQLQEITISATLLEGASILSAGLAIAVVSGIDNLQLATGSPHGDPMQHPAGTV